MYYNTKKLGLVAFYDIRPGNGVTSGHPAVSE